MFIQMVYYLIEMVNEYIFIDPSKTRFQMIPILALTMMMIKQKSNKTKEITNNKDFIR